VYTQGSTFTVRLVQEIVSQETVGKIGAVGDGGVREGEKYRPSFEAPDTRVLFVDDNELNLSVESALLAETKVAIDTAASGEEALALTLENHYDVILMDHIMPEMDGIECLHQLKRQTGGLNVHTPVIVLTANVGFKEQELYRNSGFDDYLTKPVSGAQLEAALLSFLPQERVFRHIEADQELHGIFTAGEYIRRVPVAITTSSICDLPYGLCEELGIGIIPFLIHTEGGSFTDGMQTVSGEVIDYMAKRGKKARSEPPTTAAFEEFFADNLKRANHVIHISLSKGAGREYERAQAAAQMFSSVTVVDSAALSSSVGMLALAAYQMTRRNDPAERIVLQLEELKKQISCSFVASTTDFMLSMGNITERVHRISKSLLLHPGLRMKKGRLTLANIYAGRRDAAWMKYIGHTLPPNTHVQEDVAFVTYVGMEEKDLKMIESEILRRKRFKRIIFRQASATISLNVGPGAFGILFFNEGENNYHIGRLLDGRNQPNDVFPKKEETKSVNLVEEQAEEKAGHTKTQEEKSTAAAPAADFPAIPGIDVAAGMKNCGSKKGYLTALRLFYEAADGKQAELAEFYNQKDWDAYTVKVHALKSSARIIGATALGASAEALEAAGKAGDIDYLTGNHARMIFAYAATEEILRPYFEVQEEKEEDHRPMADEALLRSAYETIREATGELDIDVIEDALCEIGDYALPKEAEEIFARIKSALDDFDYEGILAVIPEQL
ncbi:MAG: DegV family EDD domain-containing protein, partial [Lachnospiraceae bacterium]|nr:DegV family EDD domain-containing protein [Lachnospiraceae bacterium]